MTNKWEKPPETEEKVKKFEEEYLSKDQQVQSEVSALSFQRTLESRKKITG